MESFDKKFNLKEFPGFFKLSIKLSVKSMQTSTYWFYLNIKKY